MRTVFMTLVATATVLFSGVTLADDGLPVEVVDCQERTRIESQPTATVRGRLVDAIGNPVSGAVVRLAVREWQVAQWPFQRNVCWLEPAERWTTIGADGRFELPNMPVGAEWHITWRATPGRNWNYLTSVTVTKAGEIDVEDGSPPPARRMDEAIKAELAKAIEGLESWEFPMAFFGTFVTYSKRSYRYERCTLPSLSCVTKILQQPRDGQLDKAIALRLKGKLQAALDGFEELDRDFNRRLTEAAAAGVDLAIRSQEEIHRRESLIPSAVYLLSELRYFDAIPVLADVFERKERIPVSRLTLSYAMHLLALEHPREKLSPAAIEALDDYLDATKHLPSPVMIADTEWGSKDDREEVARYVWRDPLQPFLRTYPESLEVYEAPDEYGWYHITEEATRYFQRLRRFVDLAYPRP